MQLLVLLENPNYNANIKTFSFINQLYHLKFKTASVSLDEEGQTKAKLGNSLAEELAAEGHANIDCTRCEISKQALLISLVCRYLCGSKQP